MRDQSVKQYSESLSYLTDLDTVCIHSDGYGKCIKLDIECTGIVNGEGLGCNNTSIKTVKEYFEDKISSSVSVPLVDNSQYPSATEVKMKR